MEKVVGRGDREEKESRLPAEGVILGRVRALANFQFKTKIIDSYRLLYPLALLL